MDKEYQPKRIEVLPEETETISPKPHGERKEGKTYEIAGIPLLERPLSTLGEPYLIEHLGLGKDILASREIYEMVVVIDAWIKGRIETNNLKPIIGSYIEVFNGVKEILGVSENMSSIGQMNMIFDFIKLAFDDSQLKEKTGLDLKPTISGL